MKKLFFILISFLFLIVSPVIAIEKFESTDYDLCIVSRVIDGDTIEVVCKFRGKVKVRFAKLDSFESKKNRRAKRQATKYNLTLDQVVIKGEQAKKITSSLLLNKPIVLCFEDRRYGMYGRLLGYIYIPVFGDWVNINNYLLEKHEKYYMLYK
jgi:endonuclease YncB( thermonuclease family)